MARICPREGPGVVLGGTLFLHLLPALFGLGAKKCPIHRENADVFAAKCKKKMVIGLHLLGEKVCLKRGGGLRVLKMAEKC